MTLNALLPFFAGGKTYVAVVDRITDRLYIYTVDVMTGILTDVADVALPFPSGTFLTSPSPGGVSLLRRGGRVYVAIVNGDGSSGGSDYLYLYTINLSTGALTAVGNTRLGRAVGGVSLLEVGGSVYLGTTDSSSDVFTLYTIDLSNASLSQVGTNTIGEIHVSLSLLNVDGTVYAVTINANNRTFYLYTVNRANGRLTQVGNPTVLPISNYTGIGLEKIAGIDYVAVVDQTQDNLRWYTLNLSTAVLSLVRSAQLPYVAGVTSVAPTGVSVLGPGGG